MSLPCCPTYGWLSTRSLLRIGFKPFAPWATHPLGCVLTHFFSDEGVWGGQANSLASQRDLEPCRTPGLVPLNPGRPVSCILVPGQSCPEAIKNGLARTLHCWRAGKHGTIWETEVWKAETDMTPFKDFLFCQGSGSGGPNCVALYS